MERGGLGQPAPDCRRLGGRCQCLLPAPQFAQLRAVVGERDREPVFLAVRPVRHVPPPDRYRLFDDGEGFGSVPRVTQLGAEVVERCGQHGFVNGRVLVRQHPVGLGQTPAEPQSERGDDPRRQRQRGDRAVGGLVGEVCAVQSRVQSAENLPTLLGAAGVVVGDGRAGQDDDDLGLLSGCGLLEQGRERDVPTQEGGRGLVLGDAVGLEGTPVPAGFGRVETGQPGHGVHDLAIGHVAKHADHLGRLVLVGRPAQHDHRDDGLQGPGGQAQFEGGRLGAVLPEPLLVEQEDSLRRGAGGTSAGRGPS